MNMQGLFREVHHFYYFVKSHQNTKLLVYSDFIALLSLKMYTGSPQVQQTQETFMKITLTSLGC